MSNDKPAIPTTTIADPAPEEIVEPVETQSRIQRGRAKLSKHKNTVKTVALVGAVAVASAVVGRKTAPSPELHEPFEIEYRDTVEVELVPVEDTEIN